MKLPPLDIELCDDVPVGLLNMKKKKKINVLSKYLLPFHLSVR